MKISFLRLHLFRILSNIIGFVSSLLLFLGVGIPLYQAGTWLKTAEWPSFKVNTLIDFDRWLPGIAWKGVELLINEAAIWLGVLPISVILFIFGVSGFIIYNIIDDSITNCSTTED